MPKNNIYYLDTFEESSPFSGKKFQRQSLLWVEIFDDPLPNLCTVVVNLNSKHFLNCPLRILPSLQKHSYKGVVIISYVTGS